MPSCTIYHNRRCSKSRQALALLRGKGIKPRVIEYLNDPPDEKELREICKKLGIKPAELLRRNEEPFNTLKLVDQLDDDAAILKAKSNHPILIERPIVVAGNRACIGRPPEDVLQIL